MTMIVAFDGTLPAPACWVPCTLPVERADELLGSSRSLLMNGVNPVAITYRGEDVVELRAFFGDGQLVPGENAVQLTRSAADISTLVPRDLPDFHPLVTMRVGNDEIISGQTDTVTERVERSAFPGMLVERSTGPIQHGRIWVDSFRMPGSDVVRFSGKVKFSDPTDPRVDLFDPLHSLRIEVPGWKVLFEQSGRSDITYAPYKAVDGRAFNFTGVAVPSGLVTGKAYAVLMDSENRSVWDGYLPGGTHVPDFAALLPLAPRQRAESMQKHPWGNDAYSNAAGGRPCFGSPQHHACLTPSVIPDLRDAADRESFRPVQRLEADGSIVRAANHPTLDTWGLWPRNTTPDTLGKFKPDGKPDYSTGTPSSGPTAIKWKCQDIAHLSIHVPVLFGLLTLDSAVLDSLEHIAELIQKQQDYWKIERLAGRLIKGMVELEESELGIDLRPAITAYVGRMETWLDTPGTLADSGTTGVKRGANDGPIRPWLANASYSSYTPAQPYGWASFQTGLALNAAPYLEHLGLMPDRFRAQLHEIGRTLLLEGFFERGPGAWGIWYATGFREDQQSNTEGDWQTVENEGRAQSASSTRLQSLTCAPGLIWLMRQGILTDAERDRLVAILNQQWGQDHDTQRWAGAWITKEELNSTPPEPPPEPPPPTEEPVLADPMPVIALVGGTFYENALEVPVLVVAVLDENGNPRPANPQLFILEPGVSVELK